MCVYRPSPLPNPLTMENTMSEVTPENPPVNPGRRFESREYSLGITLRDQVACDVLAYMINDASCVSVHKNNSINRELSQKAFAMADAFLEERNRNV